MSAALPSSVATLLYNVILAIGNISFDYPSDAIVTNIGSASLDANQSFNVTLDYGQANVLDISALNNIGNVNAIDNGNGTVDLMITSQTTVPPTGQVADVLLSYNPITVDINVADLANTAPRTVTGVLTGDMSTNQNNAATNYGLDVTLKPIFSAAVGALTTALENIGITVPTVTLNVLTN